ncbi:MAG: hypothetical protein FJZ96_00120 [Chloroflexi bacterium]|nr:hypothetical protein [Chloroflexota bacterium]
MRDLYGRLGGVSLYAIGMAWVESAVVFYLRVMIDRVVPYQAEPLPVSAGLGWIEVGREIATLLMLAAVGWLAGQTWRGRAGYALLAFGIWDIFYYVFLVLMSGWPQSLLDWDVLFLIPLPWWGPALAPALISLLLILGGVLAAVNERSAEPCWPRWRTWLPALAGAGLALYTFMADSLHALPGGETAVRQALPVAFNWPLFGLALALMAAPVAVMGWRMAWALQRLSRPS